MKLTVLLLLTVSACYAAEKNSSKRLQKNENVKTEKRELEEGNNGVEKRAPVVPTALPGGPGIEYADPTESNEDKSQSQAIYATPLPQISKISDLLTGQGPPFQAAITSHLYSPISVYQPRLGTPTTYEVSPPIASQLAYSEHKISYQPPQNAIQYTQPVQYNQKLQAPKQANFVRPINLQQPYQQQIFAQPHPLVYSQQPHLVPAVQSIYQQIPQVPFPFQRPVQYIQNTLPQQLVQEPSFTQEQQNLVEVLPVQPGITYARDESQNAAQQNEQLNQQKTENQQEAKTAEQKTPAPVEQNKNEKSQGATSFASFSQSQAPAPFSQPARTQNLIQQQYQPQLQYQTQPQPHYQQQPQPQYQQQQIYRLNPQIQAQPQIQYEFSPQPIQYQSAFLPTKLSQESLATASTKSLPLNSGRQLTYFRPGPAFHQIQPQIVQQQSYQPAPKFLISNGNPQPLVSPSYPPVQYFGKYAQSIFGGYQQQ